MIALLSRALFIIGLMFVAPPSTWGEAKCDAPPSVCEARLAVFRIASFDPYGSAVRIGPQLLVTNRHVVADEATVNLYLKDGSVIKSEVVPTSYGGDLILLSASLPDGPILVSQNNVDAKVGEGPFYTVGYDLSERQIKVYPPGELLIERAKGRPFARIHHSSHTQPGNSGGALVDGDGKLVGIATSGGEGRFEAVPASAVAKLKEQSGPDHKVRSAAIGQAYRACTELLEEVRGAGKRPRHDLLQDTAQSCEASVNRQLIDLAGQTLGRGGDSEGAIKLFERAITRDPHAINSRIGLVVSLHLARRYDEEREHLHFLLRVAPKDPMVHRFAIQVGRFSDDEFLINEALRLIETHNPRALPAAKRFLEAPRRTPAE